MASAKKVIDSTAAAIPTKDDGAVIEPTVRIMIPLADDQSSDVKLEQVETVIINGRTTMIRRGEYVDVKVPVYLLLRQRYPNLQ